MDKYPCIICGVECVDDALECSHCLRWVHRTCIGMSRADLRSWSGSALSFLCKGCCFVEDEFDASAALDRLLKASNRRLDLLNASSSELKLMQFYKVDLMDNVQPGRIGEIDFVAQRILQTYQPVMLQRYLPLLVYGDGNCLYRAVSRAICGEEHLHILLRLKTALEIILNQKYYDISMRSYVDLIQDNRIIVSQYDALIQDTLNYGSFSDMLNFYALSAAVNQPIRSYYPPQINPELSSNAFSRKVIGRGVSSKQEITITIMWSQVRFPTDVRRFVPNHFLPLREIGSDHNPEIIIEAACSEDKNRHLKRDKPETQTSSSTYDNFANEAHSFGFVDKIEISDDSCNVSDIPTEYSIPFINDDYQSDASIESCESHIFRKSCSKKKADDGERFNQSQTAGNEKEESNYIKTNIDHSFPCQKTNKIPESPQVIDLTSDQEEIIPSFDEKRKNEILSSNISDKEHDMEARFQLSKSKFLDTETVVHILLNSPVSLDTIPYGTKENVYFIVKNTTNQNNVSRGKKRDFSDDCGVWISSCGTVPATYYLYKENENTLKTVHLKNGKLCFERQVDGHKTYIPYDPQPPQNEILLLHRYYTKLKNKDSYKRRITFLGDCFFKSNLYVVEYIGTYPGLIAHGNNTNSTSEYLRTPGHVMSEMTELLSGPNKPEQVYKTLTEKHDDISRPTGLAQIRDKKKYDKNKNRGTTNLRNDADHFQHIENLVTENHPFVRCVTRASNKTPTIILYNDEQLFDLKYICCGGHSVLGVDKTYNLCNMHVTVTCYKQVSVTRTKTGQAPVFVGPIFIHDGSDFETFCQFFSHLKMKLIDCNIDNLVIGSDDERALVKAIVSIFPKATHVLCTRHLRNNAIQKLTDDAVDKKDRDYIIKQIFNNDGLVGSEDSVCFEIRSSILEKFCSEKAPRFLNYFKDRLKYELNCKVNQPFINRKISQLWTNNNSESMNHVLKQAIDWKSKPLIDLITTIQDLSTRQFNDLRGALVGTGEYRLAESHKQFQTRKTDWINKTADQRTKLYKSFRNFVDKNSKHMTSTDGRNKIISPKTHGKKPGQKRSKVTERTHSFKRRRINDDINKQTNEPKDKKQKNESDDDGLKNKRGSTTEKYQK